MKRVKKHAAGNWIRTNETGAAALEYALILAFLAISIVVAVQSLGQGISSSFDELSQDLADATGSDQDDGFGEEAGPGV